MLQKTYWGKVGGGSIIFVLQKAASKDLQQVDETGINSKGQVMADFNFPL